MTNFFNLLIGVFLLMLVNNGASADQKNIGTIFEIRDFGRVSGYLVGISHAIPSKTSAFASSQVIDVISRSDGLVTELGLGQFILGTSLVSKAVEDSRNNKKLSTILSEKQIAVLANFLTPIVGADARTKLEFTHPWMVGNVLLQTCQVSMNPVPVDAELALIAAHAEKPIIAMEKISDQIAALPEFESLYWAQYLEAIFTLVSRVDCATAQREILERTVSALMSGNLDEFSSAIEKGYWLLDTRKFDDYFVQGRNKGMEQYISARLKSGKTYVFAIGAAHLVGSDGVMKRLERRGFVLTGLRQSLSR